LAPGVDGFWYLVGEVAVVDACAVAPFCGEMVLDEVEDGEDADSGPDAHGLDALRATFWRCCWLFPVIVIFAPDKLLEGNTFGTERVEV
jgi:hypothetical protein